MLARVLAMALCPFPSVSVTSRCSIETDERIGPVFGTEASFDLSYTVLCGNSGTSKSNDSLLPSGTFPKLWTFAVMGRSSKCVINLYRQRWTLRA